MSEIKYGLVSKIDSLCLEKTIDILCDEFPIDALCITEIGLFDCNTARGIKEYVHSKGRFSFYTGIDNEKDKPIESPYNIKYIKGNSNEVYNQLEDESQHLILIDGNHSFPYVISDYYCYKSKVKLDGYLCFHDTSPQAQGRDWQRMGDEKDPDMSISVLKALKEVGLLNEWKREPQDWELIFNEFDPNDNAGGVMIFKRLN